MVMRELVMPGLLACKNCAANQARHDSQNTWRNSLDLGHVTLSPQSTQFQNTRNTE
jgi:hypothetical protein